MSTNLEYRARERPRKREVGGKPAKLNEKKGDRDLEQEIKGKGDIFFFRKNNMKILLRRYQMRNASDQQCKVKMCGSEKKK